MALLQKPLIISVKEMRKLLGKDGNMLSDEMVEQLIMTLTETSHMLLNQKEVPKKQQVSVQ